MSLQAGDKAPHFEGVNQNGEKVSLDMFQGKKLILYFYPKDNTPGCTKESCNLNENLDFWKNNGYIIIGVSPDGEESHRKFIEKYNLQFDLIADTEKSIMVAYEAWGEKNMYGKIVEGVLRKTYVINENGTIEHIIKKVDTKAHTEQLRKKVDL